MIKLSVAEAKISFHSKILYINHNTVSIRGEITLSTLLKSIYAFKDFGITGNFIIFS